MRITIPDELMIWLFFAVNMVVCMLIAGFIVHYRRLKKAVFTLPKHLSQPLCRV